MVTKTQKMGIYRYIMLLLVISNNAILYTTISSSTSTSLIADMAFDLYMIISLPCCKNASWIEIAVDVVLSITESIHGDPVAQSFQFVPDLWISLLDPCLDTCLLLAVGSAVEPAT